MNDLLKKLIDAIFRMENNPNPNNPGSLRGAPWLVNPVIKDGFWQPPNRAMGVAGCVHVVALAIARGWTLEQFLNSYAPQVDHNNTQNYIVKVMSWTGIPDSKVPLCNYMLEEQSGDKSR